MYFDQTLTKLHHFHTITVDLKILTVLHFSLTTLFDQISSHTLYTSLQHNTNGLLQPLTELHELTVLPNSEFTPSGLNPLLRDMYLMPICTFLGGVWSLLYRMYDGSYTSIGISHTDAYIF